MTLHAVIAGPVQLTGAGDGPAAVLFPIAQWAGPAGGIKAITSANVAQTLAAARTNRTGWWIQNHSSADLWIEDTNNPVVDECLCVPAGMMFVCPAGMVTDSILKILGGTAGQKFAFRESFA